MPALARNLMCPDSSYFFSTIAFPATRHSSSVGDLNRSVPIHASVRVGDERIYKFVQMRERIRMRWLADTERP